LLIGQTQPLAAQSGMSCHAMGATQDEIPPEKLPVPQKLGGIGNAHIRITASPEAQMWFDQGLNLFHDFWDYESVRAFEQGVRVDAQCAMCYWGLYQAETFRRSSAKHYAEVALAKAVSLKGHVSKAERLYIEASAAHVAALKAAKDDGDKADQSKEIQLWRKLVKHNPKDIQARIFLAEALTDGYDDAGEPNTGQKEALAILQSVMKDEPENSAANHYWIHAVEASPKPEQALHSAEILGRLAPTSGHMVHMPGHIFYRVGDYARAQESFAASMEADERYMQAQQVQVDDDWNYVHNMMYAIANLMEQGRLADANALSDHLAAARGKLSDSLYIWSARDQVSRVSLRLPVALRVGDWDAVLTMVGQVTFEGENTTNLRALADELTDYATGMKALETGDLAGAPAASDRMDARLWRLEQRQKAETAAKAAEDKDKKDNPDAKAAEPPKVPVMPDALSAPLLKSLSIQSLELRAGILAGQGKLDDAKKMYSQAVIEEMKLGYHEPPMYIRPVGETEAAALMKAKDYAGALAAYEVALKERPGSGFGLYGIARVKELSGDAAGARLGYQSFLKAWPAADAGLPEVAHAHKVLGGQSMAEK
jgi:tetratricopeptide (TPR) repeat protein